MKRFAGAVALFILSHSLTLAQLPSLQQKAMVVKRMVELKHYSPRAVDDSFSIAVFEELINTADPRRLLFTKTDYDQLSAFRATLDDELRNEGWQFLDKFSAIYKMALKRSDSIVSKLGQKPFDFNSTETLSQTRRSRTFNFSPDVVSLANKWSRYLRFRVLDDVYDEFDEAGDSTKKTFRSLLLAGEKSRREEITKSELKHIKNIIGNEEKFRSEVSEIYLNAIASAFDPHTNYFSADSKEDFQAGLSTEDYFFGIVFKKDDKDAVIIDKLTPGGAAWKSGEINKNDELISLQWEGKEAEDMEGASLEEVFEVLDREKHDKLLFRLKKADGTITMVNLKKEKAENEENIVKSFVLKGEKKIGYILLPGFYTEWENETGSSCANDVAKEIVKLKKDNIDGLILDVRYNGGGSVGEALDMVGIFIDEGPLTATKRKDGKLQTLKDPNRGTIYDGPMALMINGQSASASELLAASLQDYNRAVIVGSNSYGKATMQQMFPLDTITSKNYTGNEKGDLIKITVGKLYRITGKTAQLVGVAPDVSIPDAFDGLEMGERFLKNALLADTVKKNNYYKPLPYLPISELSSRSAARIALEPSFQVIKKIIERQQKVTAADSRTIPLNGDQFEKWSKQQQLDLEAVKGDAAPGTKFVSANNGVDQQLLLKDAYARERNETWLKNLSDDIYIQEVFLLVADLINLQKTKTN